MRVIAGRARRLNLVTVPGPDTRPTTDRIKETLFNILQPEIPGCRFLDLFAGSGAVGIEALSRGAEETVFVEKDPRAVRCIRENLRTTRLEKEARVLDCTAASALTRLEREGRPFDVIFMDPPYNQDWEKQVLYSLSQSVLANTDTLIVVEASLETDLSCAGEWGYRIFRSKKYKTNQHIFLMKEERDFHEPSGGEDRHLPGEL